MGEVIIQTVIVDAAASLDHWRWRRNRLIYLLSTELGLQPEKIVSLWWSDLYRDQRPVEMLEGIKRGISSQARYAVRAKLSQGIRDLLAAMHYQPKLIADYPNIQPVISDRPDGRALTVGAVRRIIREFSEGLNAQ